MAKHYFELIADHARKNKPDIIGHFDILTKHIETLRMFDPEDRVYIGYATDAMDRCTDAQIAEYIDMPLWLVPPVRWLHALVQIIRKKR